MVTTVFSEQLERPPEGWRELEAATRMRPIESGRGIFLIFLCFVPSAQPSAQAQGEVGHALALEEACVAPALEADCNHVKGR